MKILSQYIVPFLILLVFLVALLATSVRAFLPSDLAAPAPMEDQELLTSATSISQPDVP